MSQYVTPIEVFNAALVRLGEDPITGTSPGMFGNLFRGAYEGYVRSLLRKFRWSFATMTEVAVYQGASGNTPLYVYVLTNKVMMIHTCTIETVPWTEYELRAGKLLTSIRSDDIHVYYTFRATEADWADDFAEGVVTAMEGLILRGPQEDPVTARERLEIADKLILDALGRDANSQSKPQRSGDHPLVRAHLGLGRHA